MNRLCFIALSFLFTLQCQAGMTILYTAAILDHHYEMRKREYLHSLEILASWEKSPCIVEACRESSFFDELGIPIFYSKVNDDSLANKGINEARSLQKALKYYAFPNNEILLKLTGRYFFTDDAFLKLVENNPSLDAFVKKTPDGPVFTGCFALRCGYLQQFLNQLDFVKMEKQHLSIESELAGFLLRNPHIKTLYVDTLHITANIFGTGTCMLTYW